MEVIMKNHLVLLAAIAAVGMVTGVASAQEAPVKDNVTSDRANDLAPVANSVELTVGTGYAQGFGNLGGGMPSLTDLATAGGGVQAGLGYRLIPELTLGAYGSWAGFGRGSQVDSSTSLNTVTAGIQADWHFLPARHDIDPWVSLGSGWRGYWADASQGDTALQGWQIAKLQAGVDYRINRALAISPVVGADLTAFFSESTPGTGGYRNVSNPNVDAFVFAGMQGRFDVAVPGEPSKVAAR
jgi:hypothetical protein